MAKSLPTGYNVEQTRQALVFIACKADILRVMLAYLAQEDRAEEVQYQIHAAKALAEIIGATADVATGGELAGGYEEWLHGPGFGKVGAA